MRISGVICECNPLHEGHLNLFRAIQKDSPSVTVALMSGLFTQRGDAAVADPFTRASLLLSHGVDLVLELPFPYSAGGSEFFAAAGVSVLTRLGVSELWFGSESADLEKLRSLADLALSDAFVTAYAERVQNGLGSAENYFALLSEFGNVSPLSPNDILALSYLKAIRKQGSPLIPFAIPRKGCGFAEEALTEGKIPSAGALRKAWKTDGLEAIKAHLPTGDYEALVAAEADKIAPVTLENAEKAILFALRTKEGTDLLNVAELSGGLGNRLMQAAKEAVDFPSFLSLAATKKYTAARLRRGTLFALCGVTEEDLKAPPAYVRLLGANRRGTAFLSSLRRTDFVPVVTKQRDLPDSPQAKRQHLLEQRAHALYSLCKPSPAPSGELFKHPPVITE